MSLPITATKQIMPTLRKTSDKSQLWDFLQNTSTACLKTVKVIKKQGKSEKPYSHVEPKET